MYTVTTIEKWRNELAINNYTFDDFEKFNLFTQMCKDDNIFYVTKGNRVAV